MTVHFIQLQAAMAFGLLLMMFAIVLVFIVFPAFFVFFLTRIRKREIDAVNRHTGWHYFLNLLEALFNAFFCTLAIAVALGLLIWIAMRDVVFM